MKRLNQIAANLYPRWWRDRYGSEFAALLDDARPGLAGTLNILKGAFAMQTTTWSLKRLTAICAIVGVAIAGGVGFTMQNQYQSIAVLRILPSDTAPADTNAVLSNIVSLANSELSRKALVNVIRELGLYKNELSREPLEQVVGNMRNAIQIVPVKRDGDKMPAFQLRFTYPDPKLSASTTEFIAKAFTDSSKKVELIEMSQASKPVAPNRVAIGLAGLTGGLLTGALLALLVWLSRSFQIIRRVPPPPAA